MHELRDLMFTTISEVRQLQVSSPPPCACFIRRCSSTALTCGCRKSCAHSRPDLPLPLGLLKLQTPILPVLLMVRALLHPWRACTPRTTMACAIPLCCTAKHAFSCCLTQAPRDIRRVGRGDARAQLELRPALSSRNQLQAVSRAPASARAKSQLPSGPS